MTFAILAVTADAAGLAAQETPTPSAVATPTSSATATPSPSATISHPSPPV